MDFLRQKRNKNIIIMILTTVCIILYGLVVFFGSRIDGSDFLLQFGKIEMNINTLQGMLQNIIFMICVVITCIDCISGRNVAFTISGITLLLTTGRMIATHNLQPLPGVFSGCMTLVIIFLVGGLFRSARLKSITDYTTSLLNQRGFLYNLDKKIADKRNCAVVYYQLNNFRAINDDYGHNTGDEVLKIVSDRIRVTVGNHGYVSRTGGAVFAILIHDKEEAEEIVQLIIQNVSKKIDIMRVDSTIDFFIESNAGIASYPENGKDRDTLMKSADVALMYATEKGSNIYDIFDDEMSSRMLHEKEVERKIKEAVEKNYFFMVYQPQYKINGKVLRGFEALLRMQLPDGTFISPAEFIPIAEKSNLIYSIDDYVIKYVFHEFAGSVAKNSNLKISINISSRSMAREDIVELIENSLRENKFSSINLEVEITEYSLSDSADQTISNIKKLRELGIQVALDDFGTGYTSLARLVNLSANVLKIDKSLVDDIEKGELNRDFINSISSMGHLMNCEVVLEGVESETQLEYIKELDCDIIQGYIWGKPVSYERALKLVSDVKS